MKCKYENCILFSNAFYTKSVVAPGQLVHTGDQAVVAVCVANTVIGSFYIL